MIFAYTLYQSKLALKAFERLCKMQDRDYHLKATAAARSTSELEAAGFPLSESIVNIVADELSNDWDVFGDHLDARERMLVRLHRIADLRKVADQIDAGALDYG